MKMHTEVEHEDGWTRWVPPKMDNYRLACCDCGSVHDFEFQVVKVTEEHPDGTWTHGGPLGPEYRVLFRARRNNRSAAGIRRHRDHAFKKVVP